VSVKIRLKRIGRKKQPTFRIVVTESRNPRGGEVIEVVGNYTPYKKDKPLIIDFERVDKWRSTGAIPTEAVLRLLRQARGGPKPAVEKKAKAEKPVEAPLVTEVIDMAPAPEEPGMPAA
jgi:small subunit ribosomal protein S16